MTRILAYYHMTNIGEKTYQLTLWKSFFNPARLWWQSCSPPFAELVSRCVWGEPWILGAVLGG
jgi:hypothetical protein